MAKIQAMKKIKQEYEQINRSPNPNIGVTIGLLDENDIFKWRATLTGPKDTSAKDGKSPYNSIQITDDKGQDKELNFQKKQSRARSGSRKQLRSSLKHGKRRKSAATKRVKFEKPKKK